MSREDFKLAYDPEIARTREYLQAVAADDDCDALIPDEYTLQLDIDGQSDTNELFNYCLAVIRRVMTVEIIEEYESRGGNRHVILRVSEPLSDLERIALQAILGSDPQREALGWMRIRQGIPYPSSLFKPRGVTLDSESEDVPF